MLITVLILVFWLVAFLGTKFASKVRGSEWLFSEFVSKIELSRTFLLVQARSQATPRLKDLIKIFQYKVWNWPHPGRKGLFLDLFWQNVCTSVFVR